MLFRIAVHNSQVFYILGDPDVKTFYRRLLLGMEPLSPDARRVRDALESR